MSELPLLRIESAGKLNNIRTIASDHEKIGDKVWERFNEKRKEEHEWYYRDIAGILCDRADAKDLEIFQQLKNEVGIFFDKIMGFL